MPCGKRRAWDEGSHEVPCALELVHMPCEEALLDMMTFDHDMVASHDCVQNDPVPDVVVRCSSSIVDQALVVVLHMGSPSRRIYSKRFSSVQTGFPP